MTFWGIETTEWGTLWHGGADLDQHDVPNSQNHCEKEKWFSQNFRRKQTVESQKVPLQNLHMK